MSAHRLKQHLCAAIVLLATAACAEPGPTRSFDVIAYQFGDTDGIREHRVEDLTQIIYSFLHLCGSELCIDDVNKQRDIENLVALRDEYPDLEILVALGGWGGCETCSDVFSTDAGRKAFARSARDLLDEFGLDGLDLDWEYPAIEGYPGHTFKPEDRDNFTALVRDLRTALGDDLELSFAAGALPVFFENSVDWSAVMPLVDRVNLMTYDLVSGNSARTGHHTPLSSTARQELSVDYAVRYLLDIGVDPQKIVIGAAFYARVWEGVEGESDDFLYRGARFQDFVGYARFDDYFGDEFTLHWDEDAQAPYATSQAGRRFATFDDRRSVALKARYALDRGLGGIMFWQLGEDRPEKGLLAAIADAVASYGESD